MTKKEFIKKYGKENFYSIIEGVKENLIVLYYNKEIPRYRIRKKEKVEFYINEKRYSLDIIRIFYMTNKEIISFINQMKKEN